jgi:hypothetical protein
MTLRYSTSLNVPSTAVASVFFLGSVPRRLPACNWVCRLEAAMGPSLRGRANSELLRAKLVEALVVPARCAAFGYVAAEAVTHAVDR